MKEKYFKTTSIHIIVFLEIFLFLLLITPAVFAEYNWPLRRIDRAHTVTTTLGEFRKSRKTPYGRFHKGIDIRADEGEAVISVSSGKIKIRGKEITIGNKRYIHVIPNERLKELLRDEEDCPSNTEIGNIVKAGTGPHLHFQESITDANLVWINPLAPGHLSPLPESLTPYQPDNNNWPEVTDIYFKRDTEDGTTGDYFSEGEKLYGKLDIVSLAHDKMPIQAEDRRAWETEKSFKTVGVYKIQYKIKDSDDNVILEPMPAIQFDWAPWDGNIWKYYEHTEGHKTVQFGDRYYIVTGGRTPTYSYWNTKQRQGENPVVDARINAEALFKDGETYSVIVSAFDRAGNGGDEVNWKGAIKKEVLIDNFLPYVERVVIKQGGETRYDGYWPDTPIDKNNLGDITKTIDKLCQEGEIEVQVYFSEVMDRGIEPDIKITYPSGISDRVSKVGWISSHVWKGSAIVPSGENGEAKLEISSAKDIAGNVMDGNPQTIAMREDGKWINQENPPDQWHVFRVGISELVIEAEDFKNNLTNCAIDLERGVVEIGEVAELLLIWGSEGGGPGEFKRPTDIAIGPEDYVYVIDYDGKTINGFSHYNPRVQVFDSSGTFIRQWGTFGAGTGEFEDPMGIAVDSSGYVYIEI